MRVNTILNVAAVFGTENTLKLLCDAMDLDYDDMKDSFPKEEDESIFQAQQMLGDVIE